MAPAIASNGRDYLVVWQIGISGNYNPDIVGARVSSAGVVLDPNGIYINAAGNDQLVPAVASNGKDYLVVWEDHRDFSTRRSDIYGARVTSDGVVLETGGFAISFQVADQKNPAVASNGKDYLVVWEDSRNSSTTSVDIYGALVTSGGVVSDFGGLAVSTWPTAQQSPSVASDGADYLVVWSDNGRFPFSTSQIFGARVTRAGAVFETTGFLVSLEPDRYGIESTPVVAFNGNNYLVVWHHPAFSSTYPNIYGARVTTEGTVLDNSPLLISNSANNQGVPALAAIGSNYLLVWKDAHNTNTTGFDIYGTVINGDGTVTDTNRIPICRAAGNQDFPAIASNGTNCFVVWQDTRNAGTNHPDIYGVQVSSAGVPADPNGQAISTSVSLEDTPAVASNGTNSLVVWVDGRNYPTPIIFGARVMSDGVIADPNGFLISTSVLNPAVACNGTDYLVAWTDYRNDGDPNLQTDIFGTRVTSGGIVLDTNGIPISVASGSQISPSIASTGTNYFVVWQDYRSDPMLADIYGTRVNNSGTVMDSTGIRISAGASDEFAPHVASDGSSYLVVWSDQRNMRDSGTDIYAARVSGAGKLVDTNGIPVCTAINDQTVPAIASNGSDYLVVWQDNRDAGGIAPPSDIYGARVTSAGGVLETNGFAICTARGTQGFPGVAANGPNYLVVWQDYRDGNSYFDVNADIYGARVKSDGSVLDAAGLTINTNAVNQEVPSIASAGFRRFLVVNRGTRDGQLRTVANFVSVNDSPVADSQSLAAVEDTPLAITLTASDAQNDPLTFMVSRTPTNGTLSGTAPNLVYTPATNYNGPDSFSFKVNDGFIDSAPATVTINVTAVNDPPILAAITNQLIDEGSTLVVTNTAADPDVPANVLTFSLGTNAPAGASINTTNGVFTWTPGEAQGPSANVITVTVADDGVPSLTDSKSFTVVVRELNAAPILAKIPDVTISQGMTLVIPIIAFDADLPANRLTFTLSSNAPAGASINLTNGLFIWTPTKAQGDTTNLIAVRVEDNGVPALSDEKAFTVIVNPAPTPFQVTGINIGPPGEVVITWNAVTGKTYRVQYIAKVDDSNWLDLSGDTTATGPSAVKVDSTLNGVQQRFYHVVQLP